MNHAELHSSLRRQLTDFLRLQHLRKTPERFAILEKCMDLAAHFDVDTLHSALETDGYHVSRATLYNTLELLCEASILNRHVFGTNQSCYELACGSHLHLICRRCHKIIEIHDPHLSEALLTYHPGFKAEYASSVVYGLCIDCQNQPSSHRSETS